MLSDCRTFLCLFNTSYVWEEKQKIEIIETKESGKGKAVFKLKAPAIVLKAHDQPPLIWSLKVKNCADGAFVTFDEDGAHLHIVELKSKLTQSTWSKAAVQFEGMFLTSLATARLLKISNFKSVTCYIAFTQDKMAAVTTANPTLLKTLVGRPEGLGAGVAWDRGEMKLPFEVEAKIVKSQRDLHGDSDFGFVH